MSAKEVKKPNDEVKINKKIQRQTRSFFPKSHLFGATIDGRLINKTSFHFIHKKEAGERQESQDQKGDG
jgi:hypothetical protein